MNKLTKGSLATGAGLVLLLGGTGTFMSWNDTGTVAGDDIVAGHLRLADTTAGTWYSSANPTVAIADVSNYQVVPGETLTYKADLAVDALGDNLMATVGLTGGAITAVDVIEAGATPTAAELAQQAANDALATDLIESATFTASGTAVTQGATADTYNIDEGTGTVSVAATIQFPGESLNDSQDGQVDLSSMAVKLSQTA